MIEFTSPNGKWKLEWFSLGEGTDGDFDPTDPNDVEYLRADLFEKVDGSWTEVENGSYCTLASVSTPPKILEKFSLDLFMDLSDNHFKRRYMELWTWRTIDK